MLVPAVKTEPVPFHAVVLVAFSLSVLEPPFKLPAVRVTIPEKVWVKPAPRFNVPPLPLIVKAAPFTLPVNVAVPELFDIVTVPVVVNALMLWVAVPPRVTPPEPLVVPALARSPFKVNKKVDIAKVTPLLTVSVPLTVVAELNVLVDEPENVRLLKVVAEAESVCATPPKLTVPVPAVNNEPVPFHAVVLVAFSLRVLELQFNVPAVRLTVPEKVWVKPEPRFNVPPLPLIVKAAPFTLQVNVAVPAVFDIVTVPVVVNAPILWVAVPLRVIPPEPLVVPALARSPYKDNKKVDIAKVTPLLTVRVPFTIVAAPNVFVFEPDNVNIL